MARTSTTEDLADRARGEAEELAGRVGELAVRARAELEPYVERVSAEAAALAAAAAPVVVSAVETVTGVLEDAGLRGSAAWAALRDPAAGHVPVRRWPWTLGAALAGAAAGAAVAAAVGRWQAPAVPDAQEPEDVRAVVDRAVPAPDAS